MSDDLPRVADGRRPERTALEPPPPPPAPPAARMLHSVAPSMPSQRRGGQEPTRPRFAANPALRLAQLAVLAQVGFGITTGVNLIRGTTGLAHVATGVTLATSGALAANYGIGILVVSGVFFLGAILVSLPSQIVRTLLATLEVVALGVTLAAHFGGGSVLGFVTILGMGATGSALIPFGAVVGLQSAVIYVLALHPPTYGAFAR